MVVVVVVVVVVIFTPTAQLSLSNAEVAAAGLLSRLHTAARVLPGPSLMIRVPIRCRTSHLCMFITTHPTVFHCQCPGPGNETPRLGLWSLEGSLSSLSR